MDHFSFPQASRQASQSHVVFFFLRKIILRWNVTLLNKTENLMRNSSVSPFCFAFFSHASPVFPLWSRPALAGLRFQYSTLTKSLYNSDQVFLLISYSKNAFLYKAHKAFKKRSLRFFLNNFHVGKVSCSYKAFELFCLSHARGLIFDKTYFWYWKYAKRYSSNSLLSNLIRPTYFYREEKLAKIKLLFKHVVPNIVRRTHG